MSNLKTNWLKILIFTVIFIGFFLFFFLRNHYYLPANLEISGHFSQETKAVLSWDSGRGFNQNEVLPVVFEAGTEVKTIELPQMGLKGLKLKLVNPSNSITINSLKILAKEQKTLLSWRSDSESIFLTEIDSKKLIKIHPLLVAVQIVLALIMTWLIFEIFNLKKRYQKSTWISFLKYIFLEEKHWIFWLMGIIAVAVYSFWLLGQWPGAATPDSFYQLYQTKSLVLEDHHPYSHTLYMLALMQFYDSFAAIAIFQIIAVSFLGNFIFYFVYKNGLKFYLILPFYLAFLSSIPVGLFNITIWKDVPFSILVVFWGFYLFYLGYQKKKEKPVEFSFKKIVILSFLFILMVFIRHNGLMYLLILPLIIVVARLMPMKVWLKFLLISAVLFVIINSIVPYVFNIKPWSKKETSLLWKINPLVEMMQNKYYISDNPVKDKAIVEKIVNPENLKKNLGWDLALYTNPINIKDEDIRAFNQLFYTRVIKNLPLYLSYRTNIFFNFLLPQTTVTWANSYSSYDGLRSFIYLWRSGTALYVQYSPVAKLAEIQFKIDRFTEYFKSIFYNVLYPTLFLLIVLFLYKWLPISARSSFFILSQLFFWFIFAIDPLFRYVYFIYLYYFFAFPLLILEIIHNRGLASKSILKNPKYFNMLLAVIYIVFIIPYLVGGVLIYHYRTAIF